MLRASVKRLENVRGTAVSVASTAAVIAAVATTAMPHAAFRSRVRASVDFQIDARSVHAVLPPALIAAHGLQQQRGTYEF